MESAKVERRKQKKVIYKKTNDIMDISFRSVLDVFSSFEAQRLKNDH
jgi:hypothetical protein